MLIIAVKLFILAVPGYISGNGATWAKRNRKKLQHAKSATGEGCKAKTLQRVKSKMKRLVPEKVPHGNGAVWREGNMKRMQYEKI